MRTIVTSVFLMACLLCFSGCVHRQPLISHAHIGHCLTTWHDTPDKQGLFEVARQELETARKEADDALLAGLSAAQKAEHIDNVAHALNPDMQPLGPGLDYGAIRALEGAVEHLEYAATSEDASPNIVSSVATLSDIGVAVLERLRNAAAQAKPAGIKDLAALDKLAFDVRTLLNAAEFGTGTQPGFQQLRTQLDAMLARESNPPYEPVERKYVLGLVRLPNGKWGFLPWRKTAARPTYGY
jgi:hypothetical protein